MPSVALKWPASLTGVTVVFRALLRWRKTQGSSIHPPLMLLLSQALAQMSITWCYAGLGNFSFEGQAHKPILARRPYMNALFQHANLLVEDLHKRSHAVVQAPTGRE